MTYWVLVTETSDMQLRTLPHPQPFPLSREKAGLLSLGLLPWGAGEFGVGGGTVQCGIPSSYPLRASSIPTPLWQLKMSAGITQYLLEGRGCVAKCPWWRTTGLGSPLCLDQIGSSPTVISFPQRWVPGIWGLWAASTLCGGPGVPKAGLLWHHLLSGEIGPFPLLILPLKWLLPICSPLASISMSPPWSRKASKQRQACGLLLWLHVY